MHIYIYIYIFFLCVAVSEELATYVQQPLICLDATLDIDGHTGCAGVGLYVAGLFDCAQRWR